MEKMIQTGRKRKRFYFTMLPIVVLTLFFAVLVYADYAKTMPIEISEPVHIYNLTESLLILEDEEKKITSDNLFDSQIQEQFVPYKTSKPSSQNSDSVYWIKMVLKNTTDETKNMFLNTQSPRLNNLELYCYHNQELVKKVQTGSYKPFYSREVKHRNFVFELQLPAQTEETVFLRAEASSILQRPIKLYSSETFIEEEYKVQLILGIYYGMMFVMFLYNLALFLSFKDKLYLYFILFILGFLFTQLIGDGLAFQFIWPSHPKWNAVSSALFLNLTSFFALQFSKHFLHIKEKSKWADQANVYFSGLLLALGLLALFLPASFSARLAVYAAAVTFAMCFINSQLAGFKNRAVILFCAAWSVLFLGVLLNRLAIYQLLPINLLTLYSPRIGAAAEVILLSLALVERFNRINQEKMAEEKQRILLESLHNITKTLTSTHDLNVLLRYTLKSLSQITKFGNGLIILKDEEQYSVKSALGYLEKELRNKALEKLEQDMAFKSILKEKRATALMDVEMDCYHIDKKAKTFIGIPIIYRDKFLGLIVLYSLRSKRKNNIENRIMYDFAGQVGISIQNLRLFNEFKEMAATDSLTGVFNRAYFMNFAEQAASELQKNNQWLSLVMVDIDFFKKINDSYGHVAGDKVLKELTKRLKEILPETGILARYGGEEFIVLLKNTDIKEAGSIAEKMRQEAEKLEICADENQPIKVTISLGISAADKDNAGIRDLIEKADKALYVSKRNGRNQVNVC